MSMAAVSVGRLWLLNESLLVRWKGGREVRCKVDVVVLVEETSTPLQMSVITVLFV